MEKSVDFMLMDYPQSESGFALYLSTFRDGSGYHMDYDLTTNGEKNDLTLQIEFLKKGGGYIVSLDDLHTL